MKFLFAGFVVLLVTWSAVAEPIAPSAGDVAASAGWFAALGPRREGSPAEAAVFTALRRWFASRADVREGGFTELDGEHSFSQRLWFRVAGARPGELVVVVPTDGVNHRGLAWAAAWADEALSHGTPVSVTFLFTGAERGLGDAAGLGSRTFLQDFYPTAPAAAVYLDASDSPAVRLTAESASFPSPLWMVRGLAEAFERQRLPFGVTGTAPSLFRLDLPERRNALDPWFQRSIPSLWVSGGPADDRVPLALEAFAGSLKGGVPNQWDRHWLAFDFGPWKLFWDQGTYLVVYLGTVVVLLFGYALLGRTRRGTLKVLGQRIWQIPVLLAFSFLALEVGGALADALEAARGQSELWRLDPLLVWSFKALVAVTLYLLLFLPFRRSPLSRDPDFYGQAALLSLGAMTLAATAFELSFSFYFLWALVWAAVLVVAPWRPLKLLALMAGPLWLFKAAFDVLGPVPDLELSRWVLASPVAGNFVLAVLFFPFLLQVNAWHWAGHRHQDRNEGLRALLQLALWAVASLALGMAVLKVPATPLDRPLEVERVDLDNKTRILESTGRVLPFVEGLWNTRVTRSAFLDRTVWNLRFEGSRAPENLQLILASTEPLTIFDCSFPVVLDPEGHRARIVVGRQPPLPLNLRLTLPKTVAARLEIRAEILADRRVLLSATQELKP